MTTRRPALERITCLLCDGDGFAQGGGNCPRCGGGGKELTMTPVNPHSQQEEIIEINEDGRVNIPDGCTGPFSDAFDCPVHDPRKHHKVGQADPVAPTPPDDLLVKYVEAEDPRERDVLFLKLYVAKVRDGTAISWEIPSVVANTLTRIADRFSKADPVAPWQPIETCPKDGTNFLAASPASSVFYAHWANGVVDSASWNDVGGYCGRHATHWMPLPSPPVSA